MTSLPERYVRSLKIAAETRTGETRTADIAREDVARAAEAVQPLKRFLDTAVDSIQGYGAGREGYPRIRPVDFIQVYNGVAEPLARLARGVLQNYQLSAGSRKWVTWLIKKTQTRFKITWPIFTLPHQVEEGFKALFEFKKAVDTALEVVATAPAISEGSGLSYTAGGFSLVNTGGFSDEVMRVMQDALNRADRLLKGSGLGKVCYGKVYVTRQVNKNNNVLAYYTIGTDDLYVRAGKEKLSKRALLTIIHELGHRFDFKFLKDQQGKIELYRSLMRKAASPLKPPQVGDTAPYATGGEATVTDVDDRYVYFVSPSGAKDKMTIRRWWDSVPSEVKLQAHPTYEGFVTPYAATNPVENFAEMFAFYVTGDLPINQSVEFEKLVFGSGDDAEGFELEAGNKLSIVSRVISKEGTGEDGFVRTYGSRAFSTILFKARTPVGSSVALDAMA